MLRHYMTRNDMQETNPIEVHTLVMRSNRPSPLSTDSRSLMSAVMNFVLFFTPNSSALVSASSIRTFEISIPTTREPYSVTRTAKDFDIHSSLHLLYDFVKFSNGFSILSNSARNLHGVRFPGCSATELAYSDRHPAKSERHLHGNSGELDRYQRYLEGAA